jgi:hypothetical protein
MPIPVLEFVFRDASSSAFSSFLATILRIYVLEPCPLTLIQEFIFDSTCAIMDVPSLPPLPLPEVHGANNNAVTHDNAIPFLA